MEESNEHKGLYLKTDHFKHLKALGEELDLDGNFQQDSKSWNSKDRNDSPIKIPYIGILSMTPAKSSIRNSTLFISELSYYISSSLDVSEQSQQQSLKPYLSFSYDLWLKSEALVGLFSISRMSYGTEISSFSMTLNYDSGSMRGSRRLFFEKDNQINSEYHCSCSCSSKTCRLHQKTSFKNENHPMPVYGLTSNSTCCMQPISSRRIPHRRSAPESPRNFKQHASMVGSYEECLVHGRMSTTPSKIFNFFAEISVLGTKKCRTSLRCPDHINIQFPAVFYNYESSLHNQNLGLESRQSPYVGIIDLEKCNQNYSYTQNTPLSRVGPRHSSKREYRTNEKKLNGYNTNQSSGNKKWHVVESGLRSSTCLPPTGGYRIPKIGQVQIIIRNLNRTPVKVFLVPYNLSEMNPGTKTFIRQRSYLTKTVVEEPLRPNSNSSKTKASKSQILHSLAHIQICSPSRNRFYIYKGIRLIFENRITDCGEKLRMEVSLPEPQYSNYKSES